MLHSTLAPENSLTAYAVAVSPSTLRIATIWWPVGFALAVFYFVFISQRYAGKVSVQRDTQGFYSAMIYVHSLGRAPKYFPERTALAANGTRSTFRELHARVGRIAAALTKHGFKAGDRLAILLPNEPDYIQLVYACAWLGVTAVPLNTRLSAKKSTAFSPMHNRAA
jgi:non-ribosomal peptide synthetase component E (peptide arylation enzyme)